MMVFIEYSDFSEKGNADAEVMLMCCSIYIPDITVRKLEKEELCC